ncbi:DUF3558 domain-containing protein [Amycolatopsis japonica]
MRRTTIILTLTALALVACSTPQNGSPEPTKGGVSPSSSPPAGPPPSVPKVEHPIDATRFKQDPCTTLTKSQVEELLGPKTETAPRAGLAGPACRWSIPSTTRPRIDVIFPDLPDSGTAAFYAAKGTTYQLLEPLESIEGYPVTAYGDKDKRAEGECSVALGISDTQTIGIPMLQSSANIGKKDPCDAAREAAIRVLATVRGGN